MLALFARFSAAVTAAVLVGGSPFYLPVFEAFPFRDSFLIQTLFIDALYACVVWVISLLLLLVLTFYVRERDRSVMGAQLQSKSYCGIFGITIFLFCERDTV